MKDVLEQAFYWSLVRGAAWCWAANLDRHLGANHSWYTACDRVRLADLATLTHLNRFCVAFTTACCFTNRSSAALRYHFANAVGASLCLAFGYHFASGVVANLGAVFANNTAGFIANLFGSALRYHLAGRVLTNLGAVFANNTANLVTNLFGATLGYHTANGVVTGLGSAFWNHTADLVANLFRSALRHHAANSVRNLTCAALASIAGAADFFLLAGWYPDLLANSFWRALHALSAAFPWCINTLASARVKGPRARLANGFSHRRSWNRLRCGFPMSTPNSDCFGVLFGNYNAVGLSAGLLLSNRLVDSAVDRPRFRLIDRFADGVLDCP